MQTQIVRGLTPEEEELRQKQAELATLEAELAQRELDLITLQTELAAFQADYMSVVGRLYAELDQVEADIAAMEAEQQPQNAQAQETARQARERADGSAKAADAAQAEETPPKVKLSDNLKKLYREIAKCYHPDLAGNDEERILNQQLMADANEAYRAGDEERLQTILRQGRHSPTAVKGRGISADLVRIIRKIAIIRQRMEAITAEIDVLKNSSLYEFKVKVTEAENYGLDLLAEMAGYLRRQIMRSLSKLANLKSERKGKAKPDNLAFDFTS